MNMRNFLGNTFQIGNFVAYPVRKGSSLWMSVGIIYQLKTVSKEWLNSDELRIGVIILRMGSKRWKTEFQVDEFLKPYADGSRKELFTHKVTISPHWMVKVNENELPSIVVEKLKQAIS